MRERPILFSGPMVRAILAGQKTMTRRPVKPQPPENAEEVFAWCESGIPAAVKAEEGCYYRDANGLKFLRRCPYGAPGDRLWVREAFREFPNGRVVYRASLPKGSLDCHFKPWKPGIHLPRALARLTLEVTEVRVERLQAITEEDARAEGVQPFPLNPEGDCWTDGKHRTAFEHAWNEMYGWAPNAFAANPWVWVVSFRRIEGGRDA